MDFHSFIHSSKSSAQADTLSRYATLMKQTGFTLKASLGTFGQCVFREKGKNEEGMRDKTEAVLQ